jgi:hypothetical protein
LLVAGFGSSPAPIYNNGVTEFVVKKLADADFGVNGKSMNAECPHYRDHCRLHFTLCHPAGTIIAEALQPRLPVEDGFRWLLTSK